MRYHFLLTLAASFLVSGCLFLDDSFHRRDLTELRLLTADNPSLRRDYEGQIDLASRTVQLSVPDYVDPAHLVVRVAHNGLRLTAAGREETGAKVEADLTAPLTLRVFGLDEQSTDYLVQVRIVPPSTTKVLVYIAVAQPDNESDPWDVRSDGWYQSYNSPYDSSGLFTPRPFQSLDYQTLEYYTAYERGIAPRLNAVRLAVKTTGIGARLDGVPLTAGLRSVDLSRERILTVEAEDLSTRDYRLRVLYDLAIRGTLDGVEFYLYYPTPWYDRTFGSRAPSNSTHAQLRLKDACSYPVVLADGRTLEFGKDYEVDTTKAVWVHLESPLGSSAPVNLSSFP